MAKAADSIDTVAWVARAGLCHQCGFCESICPESAIEMKEETGAGEMYPDIDAQRCSRCRLCLRICSGHQMNLKRYYRSYFSAPTASKYYGYMKASYIGHSTDSPHRYHAASGGLISELAAFALSSGALDAIVFARPREGRPFETETLITSDPEIIRRQKGSLYYPVPLGRRLTQLIDANPLKQGRLGLIGLPCHIHAVHKLSEFRSYNWALLFGLFCGGTWTHRATRAFLSELGNSGDQIQNFSYRGQGWPGKISWKTKMGMEAGYDRRRATGLRGMSLSSIFLAYSWYTPRRCMTCTDGLSELADLSFGDPWLKSQKGEIHGNTLVVARTSAALQLLEKAQIQGKIVLEPVSGEEVVASQKGMLMVKHNHMIFKTPSALFSSNHLPEYTFPWQSRDIPAALRLYGLISYLVHSVGLKTDTRLLRLFMTTLQSLFGRIVKRFFIRLTDRDNENYFS